MVKISEGRTTVWRRIGPLAGNGGSNLSDAEPGRGMTVTPPDSRQFKLTR